MLGFDYEKPSEKRFQKWLQNKANQRDEGILGRTKYSVVKQGEQLIIEKRQNSQKVKINIKLVIETDDQKRRIKYKLPGSAFVLFLLSCFFAAQAISDESLLISQKLAISSLLIIAPIIIFTILIWIQKTDTEAELKLKKYSLK